ncbi:glycosyl transferase family 2, partial [Dactylosporangium sucinum]
MPRCDHLAPPDEENLHLIGVATPFPDGSFDRVVNVDLWRMLNAADMSALLLEGLRIGSEVVLVWSSGLGAPLAADLPYVVAMLRPHCWLALTEDDGRGYALLRCRPRD